MPSDTDVKDGANPARDPAVRIYRPQSAVATTATPVDTVGVDAVAVGTAAAEFGGRKDGTEPTRFGDWEKQGRCIDF